MNTGVHRFFWIGVSGFLGYNLSSGIARSKGSSILVFCGNSILFLIMSAPVGITHQWCTRVPFSLQPHQHLFADLLMMDILIHANPFKKCFSICYHLWVLRVQAHWLSKLDVLELCHSVLVLKIGLPDVVFKYFIAQEGAWSHEFPHGFESPYQGWGLCKVLSQPFFPVFIYFFLVFWMCKRHWGNLEVIFRENYFIHSYKRK